MAGRSRAKSRNDITSLKHVIYCGKASVPLQKDTELYVELYATGLGACFLSSHGSSVFLICMSAQDIWARKEHKLWEKLANNTKDSFCTALWKWVVSLVNKQCSPSDHAKQLHHCCLAFYKHMRTQAWSRHISVQSIVVCTQHCKQGFRFCA